MGSGGTGEWFIVAIFSDMSTHKNDLQEKVIETRNFDLLFFYVNPQALKDCLNVSGREWKVFISDILCFWDYSI